jgi:hypothetical protein
VALLALENCGLVIDVPGRGGEAEDQTQSSRPSPSLQQRNPTATLASQTLISQFSNPSPVSPGLHPQPPRNSSAPHLQPTPASSKPARSSISKHTLHSKSSHPRFLQSPRQNHEIPKNPTHDPASRSPHSQSTPHNPAQSCTISGI